jgi:hypothetical protein
MKSKAVILIVILLVVTSCSKHLQKRYNLFENDNTEYVLKNNISEITEYKIGLDTSGNSLWKRIKIIKSYDKNGFLTKTIEPEYVSKTISKSITDAMSLESLENYLCSDVGDTNVPNGRAETTAFKYDEEGNLSSTQNEYLITYKYDKNNNEIEKCISQEYSETVCHYKRYEYDENKRVKCCIDSSGAMSSSNGRKTVIPTKKSYFKYDKNGRVIFDGEYSRKFNEKGLLININKFDTDNKSIIEKYEYAYDASNRKVSEIFTQEDTSISYIKTSVSSIRKPMIRKTYFYYDAKGFLIQEKTLNNKDKLVSLINYEYKFNN